MGVEFLIITLTACILLEGFFSGSEIAFVSADKFKLSNAMEIGSNRARLALKLIRDPSKFFSTTILGTNICTVTGTVVATLFIIENFGDVYAPLAILYWPFILILGEVVPKSVCQHHADFIVMKVAPLLFAFSMIFYPLVWLLSKFTNSLLGGMKKIAAAGPLSREELEMVLKVGDPGTSDMRLSERTMISRIFDLADKKVANIMTPLVDLIALSSSSSRTEAEKILDEHGFSRVPVYDGRVFNIVGVLDGSDLLFGDKNAGVKDLMKKPFYVPEEMSLDELLIGIKRMGEPIAVVVDEYGAATGIVTIEDLLEEVVGEISDEHDESPALYRRLGKHHHLLSGRLEIEHANEKLRLEVPDGDYQTIAGFVIHMLEHLPRTGESFVSGNFEYKVTGCTDRAVTEVEATRLVRGGG